MNLASKKESAGLSEFRETERGKPPVYFWIILMVIFTGVIIILSYFYINQKESLTLEAQENINAIADLKVAQITQWRKDRISNAVIIEKDKLIAKKISEYRLSNASDSIKEDITEWFRTRIQQHGYKSVRLVNENDSLILAEPPGAKRLGKIALQNIREARKSKDVLLSDFHFYEKTDTIHIDLVVPLTAGNDSTARDILLLEIDPYENLYPMLQAWPTASKTAESILIEKRGDSVLYLNELRHKKNTAMRFGEDISNVNVLAIKAINGETGFVEGVDYRQVPVLGVIKPIVGTPWILIANIDKEELYSPINRITVFTFIMVGLLLVIAVNVIILFVNRQKAAYFKNLYTSELKAKALEKHFQHIVKYANDIIILLNDKGKILEVNERAVSTYGYSGKEFPGMNIMDLIKPEERERAEIYFKKTDEEKEQGILFENIHIKKDGTSFPVEVSSRLITIESYKFYQEIIRDITERKKAEEKIYNLNRIYAVLSQVNEAIIRTKDWNELFDRVCDIAVRYGKFSMAWIGLLERKTNLIIPVSSYAGTEDYPADIKITGGDETEETEPAVSAIKQDNGIIYNNIKSASPDAHWRKKLLSLGILSMASFPLKHERKIVGVLNLYSPKADFFTDEEIPLIEEIILNISFALEKFDKEAQRKGAIEGLTFSENKFKTVFESANDAIILIDEARFTDFNLKAEKLFGFSRGELLNKTTPEISPERQDDGALSEAKINLYITSALKDKPQRFEWIYRKKDGTLFFAEVSLTSFYLGERIMLIAIVRDITEKKKTEEEIKDALSKAEEMNRMKSVFLANMSHELRTPMTAILGFAEILNNELTDPDQKEMAGIILKGGKRLTNTLNSILDLSRIEADKLELSPETVNLSGMVTDAVKFFEAAAKEKNLTIEARTEDTVLAYIDYRIMEQVLINLIQNAVAYTDRGGIIVRALEEKSDDKDFSVVKVIDTGIGIPENYLEAIFEPFKQVSEGFGRRFEGTGLGLTLTKKFVELMGGEILVESEPGEGSTFTVRFQSVSRHKFPKSRKS